MAHGGVRVCRRGRRRGRAAAGRDDDLDDLHVQLSAELATIGTSIADAIELGLVARFYERLGDHAVNVARRIDGLARADVAPI